MNVNSITFLCGYFSTSKPFSRQIVQKDWETVQADAKTIESFRNYYYSEFVDFFTNEVSVFKKSIERDISIVLHENGNEISEGITIADLTLFQMPMGLALFSISLKFKNVEHDNYASIISQLRNCGNFKNKMDDDFFKFAISEICTLYQASGGKERVRNDENGLCAYPFLVEHGNKFKVFQIATTNGFSDDAKALRNYVFCLGSFLPANDSNEEAYIDSVSNDCYISVFKDWKGLALLDSITIYANNPAEWQIQMWKNVYFERIYIYELYRKAFLYRLNCNFHSPSYFKKTHELQEEMRVFERNYDFVNFSYNFMPKLFDSAIDSALESKAEETIINHLINRDIANEDEKREAKTNHLLLFLSIMAGFSAIWDLFSLIKDYSQNGIQWCPTLITLGMVIALITVVLLSFKRK